MKLTEIRKKILVRNPTLAHILAEWGDSPVLQYYTATPRHFPSPSPSILSAIHDEVRPLLGNIVATQAKDAVASEGWVNTADHHGVLFHPYFFSNTLVRSHPKVCTTHCTVTLPFGGVSLSNDSFPRGFALHDAKGALRKVIFKSLSEKHLPVYVLGPITPEVVKRERQRMSTITLLPEIRERIDVLFTRFLDEESVWTQATYSAQLTVMNSILWEVLFDGTRGDFVSLEIETVVRRLLLTKHLVSETAIFHLIFNAEWRDLFVSLFSGAFGSHNPNSGTHLFWYIDHVEKRRKSLRIKGSTLITDDGSVCVELVPENIALLLEARVLMPTTALTLITICGVEHLTCGGGLSQVVYLPDIIKRWKVLLHHMGFPITDIPESIILSGDSSPFRFGKGENAPLAMLFDLVAYTPHMAEEINHILETVTMNEAVDALLPIFHAKQEHISLPFFYEQTSL